MARAGPRAKQPGQRTQEALCLPLLFGVGRVLVRRAVSLSRFAMLWPAQPTQFVMPEGKILWWPCTAGRPAAGIVPCIGCLSTLSQAARCSLAACSRWLVELSLRGLLWDTFSAHCGTCTLASHGPLVPVAVHCRSLFLAPSAEHRFCTA